MLKATIIKSIIRILKFKFLIGYKIGGRNYLNRLMRSSLNKTGYAKPLLESRIQYYLDHHQNYSHDKVFDQVSTFTQYIKTVKKTVNAKNLPDLKRPIIIIGLPRTGSTLLQRLLAQDPDSYSLTVKDLVLGPFYDMDDLLFEMLFSQISDDIAASHPMKPDHVDEELLIMGRLSPYPFPLNFFYSTPQEAADGFKSCYRYLHNELRCFQKKMGDKKNHWVLKTPIHSYNPEMLHETFGQPIIIQTTRDVAAVYPSSCRIAETLIKLEGLTLPKKRIGKDIFEHLNFIQQRLDDFTPDFVIPYEQLIEEPIATIENIYEELGWDFSNEFSAQLKQWHEENPQGKHGRHSYSLEDYGMRLSSDGVVILDQND